MTVENMHVEGYTPSILRYNANQHQSNYLTTLGPRPQVRMCMLAYENIQFNDADKFNKLFDGGPQQFIQLRQQSMCLRALQVIHSGTVQIVSEVITMRYQ